VVEAVFIPFRNMSYLLTASLSEEISQLRTTELPVIPEAIKFAGAVGAIMSRVLAVITLRESEIFPAASAAVTIKL
jgi:hypothetical protein